MNIDLLYAKSGEAGLVASRNFVKKIAGVLFSMEDGLFTLEYKDMETQTLNIPVETDFTGPLHDCVMIYIGACQGGHIAQAYKVPFIIVDDPYRHQGAMAPMIEDKELAAFGRFIKSCVVGQPVHRENLGDEAALTSVLGEAGPASLQFAPHLARRHALEARPTAAPQINVPGFSVPGLGGSSSGGGARPAAGTPPRKPPPDERE